MRVLFNLMIVTLLATWLSATLTAADQPVSTQQGWGNLHGQIIVRGNVPSIRNERIPSDLAICLQGELGIKDDNLLVDPAGGLADVFVMLIPDDNQIKPSIHPSYQAIQGQSVTLEFDNCRLQPHAILLQTGQELVLKNNDDVGHHCQIDTFQNSGNLLVARQSEYSFRFQQPDRTPGTVKCGIHKWIDALILVKDHPYNDISQPDGRFEINNIPAGKWKFMFWHSKTGYLDEMEVAGFEVSQRGEITARISAESTVQLGQIIVPARVFKD